MHQEDMTRTTLRDELHYATSVGMGRKGEVLHTHTYFQYLLIKFQSFHPIQDLKKFSSGQEMIHLVANSARDAVTGNNDHILGIWSPLSEYV